MARVLSLAQNFHMPQAQPKKKLGKFFLKKTKKKKKKKKRKKYTAVPRKDGYIRVHKYYKILQGKKFTMTKSKDK